MSWVTPDREIIPRPSTHTPANAQLDAAIVVNSRKLNRKYRTNRVLNPGPVVCESSTLSARPQRLPTLSEKNEFSKYFTKKGTRGGAANPLIPAHYVTSLY